MPSFLGMNFALSLDFRAKDAKVKFGRNVPLGIRSGIFQACESWIDRRGILTHNPPRDVSPQGPTSDRRPARHASPRGREALTNQPTRQACEPTRSGSPHEPPTPRPYGQFG